jgi:hypothetical protein
MNSYTAEFQTDANYATLEIEAATPQEALAEALKVLESDKLQAEMYFTPYDAGMLVNAIFIFNDQHDECAHWNDEQLRVRLAASDLLDALEELVKRDQEEARECGFTDDEMTWLEDARRAIAKAKGGAA